MARHVKKAAARRHYAPEFRTEALALAHLARMPGGGRHLGIESPLIYN